MKFPYFLKVSGGLTLLPVMLSAFCSPVEAAETKAVEFVNNGLTPVRVSVYEYSTLPGASVSVALSKARLPGSTSRMRLPFGCYSFCVRWYTGRTNALMQRIYAYTFYGGSPSGPQVCLSRATPDNAPPRIHVASWEFPAVGMGVGAAGNCPGATLVSGGASPRTSAQIVANTNCSLLPNSHAVYNPATKSAYCACNSGYTLKNGTCTRTSAPQGQGTAPINLAGEYVCLVHCPASGVVGTIARIEQNGNQLVFINEKGHRSAGRFLSRSRVVATNWGNLRAEIHNGGQELRWTNRTIWRRR